jgi:hypothetical protein
MHLHFVIFTSARNAYFIYAAEKLVVLLVWQHTMHTLSYIYK